MDFFKILKKICFVLLIVIYILLFSRYILINSYIEIIIYSLIISICIFIVFIDELIQVLISLLFIYILIGILYICLGLEFLGVMSLIIFAGAIVVLFIFVLMLVDLTDIKKRIDRTYIFLNTIEFYLINSIMFFILLLLCFVFKENNVLIYLGGASSGLLLSVKKKLVFHDSLSINEFIENSIINQISYILFEYSWFETIFLGLILLISLVIIINFFKR